MLYAFYKESVIAYQLHNNLSGMQVWYLIPIVYVISLYTKSVHFIVVDVYFSHD